MINEVIPNLHYITSIALYLNQLNSCGCIKKVQPQVSDLRTSYEFISQVFDERLHVRCNCKHYIFRSDYW